MQIYLLEGPTNAFGFISVILLHSNPQQFWATHMAIFRVVRTRVQIWLQCVENTPQLKIIQFLL